MVDIPRLLRLLAEERPLFHSEADFQHSLAWKIREQYPNYKIRLERPEQVGNQRQHVDIEVINQGTAYIELKYKKHPLQETVSGESYDLRGHSAPDLARCGFWEDINKLERIVDAKPSSTAYVVMLTNDSSLWRESSASKPTNDEQFRIFQGREVSNESLNWPERASRGTRQNHKSSIKIVGTYKCDWRDYHPGFGGRAQQFRYLLLKIK